MGIALRPGGRPCRVPFNKECFCHQLGTLQLQKGWGKAAATVGDMGSTEGGKADHV